MDKVVMVRTAGNEFILGFKANKDTAVVSEGGVTRDTIHLEQARIFNVQMTKDGPAIALVPVVPFVINLKKYENIDIDMSNVLAVVDEADLDGELVNAYKSNVTGIDLSAANANKNIII